MSKSVHSSQIDLGACPAGHAACTALIPWESWDLMTAAQSLVKEFQSLVKEFWGTALVVFALEIFRNRGF